MGPLLDVRDVAVNFGGLRALRGVSLAVPEGSIVGLIGPNGAGKTTLFNVVSGLQRPDAGQVIFGDREITRLSANRRAELGIRRAFQHLGVINDQTVGTNILAAQHLTAGYRGADIFVRPWRWRAAERRIGADATAAAGAFGLLAHWSEQISDLSFGTARFVDLACVSVGRPRLMLLDEPTTGLDLGEVSRLLHVLRELRSAGATILLVAHDVRFIMDICDHVHVLAEGTMLYDGPPADVQSHPAVIDAYLGSAQ